MNQEKNLLEQKKTIMNKLKKKLSEDIELVDEMQQSKIEKLIKTVKMQEKTINELWEDNSDIHRLQLQEKSLKSKNE